ncbi:MAG: hypothetical protein J6B89_03450 [Bacilli bacterium]|nr:hypothetical protein [Bacilli bacterium]
MRFDNQYLEYVEYLELEGSLEKGSFNLLEYRAEKEVDEVTHNRFRKLKDYPKALKLCINELIAELKSYNENSNKSSETVGSYSVSYNKPVTSEEKKKLRSIIKTYLSNTKVDDVFVLYCGADEDDN